MQKKIIIILSFLSVLQINCTKLKEDPKGQMSPNGFFKTPADVESAVHGAYAEWVTTPVEKSFLLALMLRSDMVDIGDLNTDGGRIDINNFKMDAYNSLIADGWSRLYRSISAANMAIKAARTINAESNIKNKLEAQARFIRAFTYFHLVRCFSAVPYLDAPVETTAVLDSIKRMPEDEVYNRIIEDLIFAKKNLPAQNEQGVRNIGTEGSAATVLADVYLTLKRYKDAADEARLVINNATRFNYQLEKNYQDLFNGDIEVKGPLKEQVFTLDLKTDLHEGEYNQVEGFVNLTRVRDLAPRSLSVAVPSLKVYNSWDSKDYRKKVSFEDTVIIKGVKTALITAKVRVPRPHIAKYFRYPGPQIGDDRSSNHHYCLYRYAEVLLIAAEAINEVEGATNEAIGYVNQIRERARFNGNSVTNYPANLTGAISQEAFRQILREERRLEFAFEFNRWYDIKRWGIINEAFAQTNSLELHEVDPQRDYLFPIPQSEISTAGLSQNTGY